MRKYSVLLSVYYKESPDFLDSAVDSMFQQTLFPDEFVLICDGPLTDELNAVIKEKKKKYPEVLRIIRLSENRGLGTALQVGLKNCRNEFVARMDSDDISLPDRCEKQVRYMEEHPDISIIGGAISEFQMNPSESGSKRIVPEDHENIIAYSKSRNPFNHMTVMYRKSHVLNVGGYKHLLYLEDYYLWIRMFLEGYRGHNLQDVLVCARVGNGMIGRRSGIKYAKSQKALFKFMLKHKYITIIQFIKAVTGRTVLSLCPTIIRKYIYAGLLRVE